MINNARVPILTMVDRTTKVSVDICLNNQSGPAGSQMIRSYVEAFPPLRPLALTLKYFLKQQNINEPHKGGMGSYLVVLLIISLLQEKKKRRAEGASASKKRKLNNIVGDDNDNDNDGDEGDDDGDEDQEKKVVHEEEEKEEEEEEELGGMVLMEFFARFGLNVDYSHVISLRNGGHTFPKDGNNNNNDDDDDDHHHQR